MSFLAIGEQEREIQNAQVLSMPSKSNARRTYVWVKAKRTCVLFSYWRAREGNSECHHSPETKGHTYGLKAKGHVSFLAIGEQERGNSECTGVVNAIKVRRQKDICMGKSQKDMCPF